MNNLVSSHTFLSHTFANCIFTGGMTLIISMFFSFVKKSEYIHQKYLSNTNLIIRQNEQLNKLVDKIVSLEQKIADLQFELENSKKKLFINSTILEPILEEVLEDMDQYKNEEEEEEETNLNIKEPIENEKEIDQNKEIINEKVVDINELIESSLYKGIAEDNTTSINDPYTNDDNFGFEFVDKSIRHNRNKRVYKWYNYFY
jgi:chromosome segregation ATPase